MNWISIDTGIADDARIGSIAAALKRDIAHVVGLVVCVLTHFPKHARAGDIAGTPPETIEKWANWHGRRGAFDAAFRAQFCTPDGLVRSWDKWNGKAIQRLDADAERKREERERKRAERAAERAEARRKSTGPSTGQSAGQAPDELRTSGRDQTKPNQTKQTAVPTATTTDTPPKAKIASGGANATDTPTARQSPVGAVSGSERGSNGKPVRLSPADLPAIARAEGSS